MESSTHAPRRRRRSEPARWRLSSECPDCGRALRLRRRREDGRPFVGCAAYPACRFAEDYDEVLVGVVAERDRLDAEVDGLVDRIVELEDELEDARTAGNVGNVSRELKALVYRWHPDRHPAPIPPAEVVAELLRLRAEVAA